MSKISNLINTHCQKGVPFSPLGELCDIKTGSNINKNYINANSGIYPVINSGKTPLGFVNIYNTENNPLGITTRGNVGFITWQQGKYYRGNLNYSCSIYNKNIIIDRYLFHLLNYFQPQIHSLSEYGSIPALNKNKLSTLKIPLPPLEVQLEIVNILDAFTKLEAELEAELEARLKQYNYYLNHLLTFSPTTTPFSPLGEIMTIRRGASPRPISKYLTHDINGINWIKIGDVITGEKYITKTVYKISSEGSKKSVLLKKGDFILSNSMSFGRPYILNISGCIHDGWISMSNFEKHITPNFLYYLLSSQKIQQYWISKASRSSVSNLNIDIVKSLKIPIPPLAKQQEIVNILDKFNTLTTDISIGLPAEIAKRKQQYTHYRNKLLTFKELPQ